MSFSEEVFTKLKRQGGGYVRRMDDALLPENWFLSLADASDKIKEWRDDYNCHCPHSSPGDLSSVEFAESYIASGQPTADLQQYSKARSSVKFA